MKDEVTVGLDTTGDSLHKRGYRKFTAKAPIAENLAAALIHAYSVEREPNSGGSLLWKRYIPYRSCYDGCQYGAGNEAWSSQP